jgi:NADH dehydrogenase
MKRVLIIGGGFGGLSAAKSLLKYDLEIVIIDKTNHHLFQPLLYQVATAALSPADIAHPIRSSFGGNKNVSVLLGEVTKIDRDNKKIFFNGTSINYDYLIVAVGSRHHYFGNPEWEKFAPGLKTLNDALQIREKILLSLETAEKIQDVKERKKFLNYVIVGGGPTGVELAGAIGEIVNKNLIKDYRNIDPGQTKVFLVEAVPKILVPFPDKLSQHAKEDLEALGVEVILNSKVTDLNDDGVRLGDRFIESKNIIWAAGNQAMPLLKNLNTELDSAGRAIVNHDLTVDNDPDVFVIGDAAAVKDDAGKLLSAIAPVAIQQGKYIAKIIGENISKEQRKKFKYRDRGIMATIGKAKAVAVIKGFNLSGLFAWLVWCVIHILFLISFRNRFRVMAEWMWYYITNRPGIRLIVKYTK